MKDAAILTGRKLNDFWVGELLRSLSRMKCTELTAEEAFADFKEGPEAAQEIVEIYQKALKEEGGCDSMISSSRLADLLENDQKPPSASTIAFSTFLSTSIRMSLLNSIALDQSAHPA
ncbi:MAG: hypothetical protein R2839_02840 [Thermomicrobiales bacterium]